MRPIRLSGVATLTARAPRVMRSSVRSQQYPEAEAHPHHFQTDENEQHGIENAIDEGPRIAPDGPAASGSAPLRLRVPTARPARTIASGPETPSGRPVHSRPSPPPGSTALLPDNSALPEQSKQQLAEQQSQQNTATAFSTGAASPLADRADDRFYDRHGQREKHHANPVVEQRFPEMIASSCFGASADFSTPDTATASVGEINAPKTRQ